MTREHKIAVIGLGYVGFPLACLFASRYPTKGYDINSQRVAELRDCHDRGDMLSSEAIGKAHDAGLRLTDNIEDIRDCNTYVVAMPTPVNMYHDPDLRPLEKASAALGAILKKGDTVIYESTVYPGVTEEVCVPELEKASGLKLNEDFTVGYSPERINPGDKERTVEKIRKITSGSTPEAAAEIDALYNSVLENGTYPAPSIRVAEAAKIIENSQRDVNIAFVNEIAKVMRILDIDPEEVFKAAATKWNFLSFQPGLVGGHCIGVDPYYLIKRSEISGLTPGLMSAARRINDTMGDYVAKRLITGMMSEGILVRDSKILMLGFTFKENCPDIRNTKVMDVYNTLRRYAPDITIFDPMVDPTEAWTEYSVNVTTDLNDLAAGRYNAIIACVAHDSFAELDVDALRQQRAVVMDIKGALDPKYVTMKL